MSSPEDIANDAFKRIFQNSVYENNEQIRLFFNQDGETRTDCVYLNTFLGTQQKRQEFTSRPDGIRKRQKSPTSHHVPLHSPFAIRRFVLWKSLNSLRKTKSATLPVVSKALRESRKISTSTPDLMMEDQNTDAELNPNDDEKHFHLTNKSRFSRTMCYYNLELFSIILNCITLAIGMIYFACATMMACYKEMLLFILNVKVYILSIFSLYTTAIILLMMAIGGLCFFQLSKKTLAKAVFAVLTASILISFAIIQKSYEIQIQQYAESQMLSTIKYEPFPQFKEIWDSLHKTFKCCGAKGYLDLCTKEGFDPRNNSTDSKEFFGLLVCNVPSSCCLEYRENTNHRHELCLESPTPWNSYQTGCIMAIKAEISFLGKVYRIVNIGLTIILLLSATISVTTFTQLKNCKY